MTFMQRLRMQLISVSAKFLCVVALLFFIVGAPATCQDKPTSLPDARSAVEANLRTSEGKAYDEQLAKEFPQKYLDTMRECKKSAGADFSSFWILLRLDKDGAVKEVLLSPSTKLGSCVRDALLKGKFTAPPKAAYWVSVYIRLSH